MYKLVESGENKTHLTKCEIIIIIHLKLNGESRLLQGTLPVNYASIKSYSITQIVII